MSKIAISGNASGSGVFTIAAPNTNSDYTINLPAASGDLVVTGGAQTIEFADGSASTPSITNSGDTNTGIFFPAADTIAFSEGGTESMRIDSSGNLLVGTTSANGILTVSSAASNAVAATIANTSASPYGLLTDFTSDPNNATNYGYKFRLTNNTNIYTIFSNGTTSARSDERFKKDIETTRNGYVEDLTKLRVVKYRWQNAEQDSPKELGFIAQEVEKVFPGLISTEINDDGIDVKSIKTSVFIPMLVKAIQELSAKNDALEARIAALEGAANVPT